MTVLPSHQQIKGSLPCRNSPHSTSKAVAVTKTRNGMERDGTLRNFPVMNKSFDLGLGISKSKFLGFRGGTIWLQGKESGKEQDGLVCSGPFSSGF